MRPRFAISVVLLAGMALSTAGAQKYTAPNGRLRVALAKQPFSPTGLSTGPATMADGGIRKILADFEGGLSLAAVNRMIAGAVRGVQAREKERR